MERASEGARATGMAGEPIADVSLRETNLITLSVISGLLSLDA
jgi:hypothetical protein